MMAQNKSDMLLKVQDVSKFFPGVKALQDVSLDVKAGEVHAILGENGAGKSTLMKILTGVYQPDKGDIIYRGKKIEVLNPHVAQEIGISIIHQEFNLFSHLTVAQNIFIGREPRYARYVLNEKKLNEEANRILQLLNYSIDVYAKVSTLSVAEQQMVEIAKAISVSCDILIMDEPTATLSEAETEVLFSTVRRLKEQGKGIIFISHKLKELEEIADRVTVFRDGQYIDTLHYADTTTEHLIHLMVGRELTDMFPKRHPHRGEEILRVENIQRNPDLKNISFSLCKGEILGVSGLVGAGRTELMRAIFGADPKDSGKVFVHSKEVTINTPRDAIRHGIGYLTEDRKKNGLALNLNVQENIILATIKEHSKKIGIINKNIAREHCTEFVDSLRIKTPSLTQIVRYLSGGNQQKVIIARWLCTQCDVLIFDEPTRGIDVGARREIYDLITSLTDTGLSIIMVSSDLSEIVGMSDRVLVMCSGEVSGILEKQDITQEKIMLYATGHMQHEN